MFEIVKTFIRDGAEETVKIIKSYDAAVDYITELEDESGYLYKIKPI